MTDQLKQHPQADGRSGVDPAFPLAPVPGRSSHLIAALTDVQQALPRIRKDQTAEVETQKGRNYSYSYADLTAVSAAVLPLLAEHGLAFTTFPTLTPDGKFVLRYHLLHTSGEQLAGEYPLPSGVTAQAMGSAITYARRYCLCAVTGVSPDDDDDAAAAVAGQAAENRHRQPLPRAVTEARNDIKAAWRLQYGEFNEAQAADMFGRWSGGELLREAPARRLRAFAAYLDAMPRSEAGGHPADTPVPPPQADGDGPEDVESGPRPLTRLQRARIFAELNSRGVKDAAEQRTYIGEVIGRPIKSRSEITLAEAKVLIDHFEMLGPPPGTEGREEGA